MWLQQGLVIFFPNKDNNYLSPFASAYTPRNVQHILYLQKNGDSKFQKSRKTASLKGKLNMFQKIPLPGISLLI